MKLNAIPRLVAQQTKSSLSYTADKEFPWSYTRQDQHKTNTRRPRHPSNGQLFATSQSPKPAPSPFCLPQRRSRALSRVRTKGDKTLRKHCENTARTLRVFPGVTGCLSAAFTSSQDASCPRPCLSPHIADSKKAPTTSGSGLRRQTTQDAQGRSLCFLSIAFPSFGPTRTKETPEKILQLEARQTIPFLAIILDFVPASRREKRQDARQSQAPVFPQSHALSQILYQIDSSTPCSSPGSCNRVTSSGALWSRKFQHRRTAFGSSQAHYQ